MSLKKILLERVLPEHTPMYKKINTFLEDEGYDVEYLTRGTTAYIFQVKDKKKAIRLSYDPDDIEIYEAVEGQNFDNVVEVYYTKVFGVDSIISVQELLSNIPRELFTYLDDASFVFHSMITDEIKDDVYTLENLYKAYTEHSQYGKKHSPDHIKTVKNLIFNHPQNIYLKQILNGINELMSIGYLWGDRHAGNFMYDRQTDQIKIIDLGDYRKI